MRGSGIVGSVLLAALALSGVGVAAPERQKSPALAILKVAMEKEKDAAALAKALADLDALIKKQPKDPDALYARGWVLSHLGRSDQAVAAYDQAFEIDETLAAASYNAGVVLAETGRQKEALMRFDRALAADPKLIDAAYNAGQGYYNVKDFAKAAERWETASRLAPDDFDVAKKLVQTYVALGKDAEAAKARARVFALKKAAKDPKLAAMKSYVYDQFDLGAHHIYVYEAFDTSGDLAYVYKFVVTYQDKPVGSVNLETSAVIREQGVPFILGMDKPGRHTTLGKTWRQQPAYKVIKAEATKAIEANF
ncbi:MAG TPA: tetratricopeptide repeat protein [Polyangia bacterium]|jgi:tetratricopeptide (TPR) repeat protein